MLVLVVAVTLANAISSINQMHITGVMIHGRP